MGAMLSEDDAIEGMKEKIHNLIPSPRAKNGWALTLHLTQQVILAILVG